MTETPILDAPTYSHGFVVGRYLTAVADGPDADRFMDFTPAKGKVIFTPEAVIRRHEGPAPALVVQRPVTCALDDQGYLTSPGGGRGVALIAGTYKVRFDVQDAQVPGPTRIEVKESHTEDAPLDLVLAMPDVVPPGSVVVVDETTAQRASRSAQEASAAADRAEGAASQAEASATRAEGHATAAAASAAEATTAAPRLVPLVSDGFYLGAAGGENVPLGTLGRVTSTPFVSSSALLIRSSTSRWSSWSILRGRVSMSKTWLNGNPYPEVGVISFGADQTEARVINFSCSIVGTDTVKWGWSVFVPDDMGDNNGEFFYRWSDALGITPTKDYVHPETGEVGKLYPLKRADVDVPDYGGMYNDDSLIADALTFDASRIRLVRTAK